MLDVVLGDEIVNADPLYAVNNSRRLPDIRAGEVTFAVVKAEVFLAVVVVGENRLDQEIVRVGYRVGEPD